MMTAISIEDVRREVTILKALSGHKNLIKFYDAFEDANNVYVVMEYVIPVVVSFPCTYRVVKDRLKILFFAQVCFVWT